MTAFLGLASPLLAVVPELKSGGRWCVGAIAVVMLGVTVVFRRMEAALALAIVMSASALSAGAAVGFMIRGILHGSTIDYLLAVKWALGAAILTRLLFYDLKRRSRVEVQREVDRQHYEAYVERLKAMSDPERIVEYQTLSVQLQDATEILRKHNAVLSRRLWFAGIFVIAGMLAVYFSER